MINTATMTRTIQPITIVPIISGSLSRFFGVVAILGISVVPKGGGDLQFLLKFGVHWRFDVFESA